MRLLFIIGTLALTGCQSSDSGGSDPLKYRTATLPDGFAVTAEMAINGADMERGMMYRTELSAGRGMLFFHGRAGRYPYWMANCKIPLDIIWMDDNHKVVEISANTPPCPSGGQRLPHLWGKSHGLLRPRTGWRGGRAATRSSSAAQFNSEEQCHVGFRRNLRILLSRLEARVLSQDVASKNFLGYYATKLKLRRDQLHLPAVAESNDARRLGQCDA